MKQILLFILLFNLSAKAQITGIIKDSLTGKPIQFATIWVENEKIGANSQTDGTFSINAEKSKKISISVLGYKTKKATLVDNIEILLQPIVYELNEVAILPRRNKNEIEIGSFKKSKIESWHGSGSIPVCHAKLVQFNSEIKKHPFLKCIEVNSSSYVENAIIELKFLEVQNDGSPGNIINEEIILFNVKKDNKLTKFDVSKYSIKIPENGIFIAFQWLILEQNKKIVTIYDAENQKKITRKEFISYQPFIGTLPSDKPTTWTFWGGTWNDGTKANEKNFENKKSKYINKYSDLAIRITLTD